MMKTVEISRKSIHSGFLILVNLNYPIREYQVSGLIPADDGFSDVLLSRAAATALQFALKKIAAGNKIIPISGYRTSVEQADIYNDSLCENGEIFTKKYVALPDHSEHQTALAIDLALNKDDIDFLCPDFPYEGICDEFRKIAPEYGFIQRYTEDKEKITGISHEPWHFRYVGYPHSKIITEQGLSLEEYMEFVKNYREHCRLIYTSSCGAEIEIYYVPANNDKTLIVLPEYCVYQISGNNIDGFIVTVWRENNEQKLYGH